MIKIYSNGCRDCNQLKFWKDKVSLDIEIVNVETSEDENKYMDKYNSYGFPIILINNKLTTFNDCMDLFKINRK